LAVPDVVSPLLDNFQIFLAVFSFFAHNIIFCLYLSIYPALAFSTVVKVVFDLVNIAFT
jgi:hypothetical protein